VSLIIDDSTCLVNLAHFCIPQFNEVFPDRYPQDWRRLPREIPDSFVREFGEWCRAHGVKGKYSIVPNPACVGWLDRELPGWSRKEVNDSLRLVREFMTADWDIHPEMVTHTWVIDTKTGRPYPERSARFMENWDWTAERSTEELTDYMAYALKLIRNVDLPCEGITTPGGFAHQVLPGLARATLDSCRDVFRAEVPHYFRHLFTDDRSVAPRVELASGLSGPDPRCVVSIIGCTGDWFGGWDGLTPGSPDLFVTEDLSGGRLVDVIERGEPAVLVCHWPGIYYNGDKVGFRIFQEVVRRLHARYDHLAWMKLSEIARYWAARQLTVLERCEGGIRLQAPFAAPDYTLEVDAGPVSEVVMEAGGTVTPLREVGSEAWLDSHTWCRTEGGVRACFDLERGDTTLRFA
jgi:hypothetical protein